MDVSKISFAENLHWQIEAHKEVFMALMRWDPFQELADMQNKMSRVFDEDASTGTKQLSVPTTDIYDENGSLVVETEIPNFDDDDIEVDISDNVLEIRAEKQSEEKDNSDRRYVLRESSSSYYRRVGLPKGVDTEGAEASYDNGVLRIIMPKEEKQEKKRLEINK